MNGFGRMVLGGTALLALGAGAAHGQIASPSLVPGTANVVVGSPGFDLDPSFAPLNPAVMSHNKGSVFGLGQTNVDRDVETPKQTESYSGNYGGFRWTGDRLAIALETLNFSSDSSKVDFTYKTTGGAVSGKVADWVSLGAGLNNSTAESGNTEDTVNHVMFGASVKIGNVFFAGLGTGRDSLDHKSPGGSFKDDRSVTQYGLGLYTGAGGAGGAGGGTRWHLEYNVEEKDDYTDRFGNDVGGLTRTNGVIELNWSNLLLSYTSYNVTAKTGDGQLDGTALEVGWAPEKGFVVSARLQNNVEKDGGTKISDSNSMSLNVGYQF